MTAITEAQKILGVTIQSSQKRCKCCKSRFNSCECHYLIDSATGLCVHCCAESGCKPCMLTENAMHTVAEVKACGCTSDAPIACAKTDTSIAILCDCWCHEAEALPGYDGNKLVVTMLGILDCYTANSVTALLEALNPDMFHVKPAIARQRVVQLKVQLATLWDIARTLGVADALHLAYRCKSL